VAWILENFTAGADSQENIREFIDSAHTHWGTDYFLLGGEADIVPIRSALNGDQSYSVSDQYYASLDSGDDWTNTVYVGRVSTENTTECEIYVNKVLYYEKSPPLDTEDNYLKRIALLAESYFEETNDSIWSDVYARFGSLFDFTIIRDSDTCDSDSCDCEDSLNCYSICPGGITPVICGDEQCDSDAMKHRNDFINALDEGQHLVSHFGHATNTGGRMGTGHSVGIDNYYIDSCMSNDNMFSIIISPACCGLTNFEQYEDFDCISEHFLFHNVNTGAVAFMGNTWSGHSSSLPIDTLWWTEFSDESRTDFNVGKIFAEAKNRWPITDDSSTFSKFAHWRFNLHGEPAIPIWTDIPDTFLVTLPDIFIRNEPCTVLVKNSSNNPESLATVCLWQKDTYCFIETTNSQGHAIFNKAFTVADSIIVTISKYNFKPYQSKVFVIVTGCLKGTVLDKSDNPYGYPVENVRVRTDPTSDEDTTDSNGEYFIDSVFANTYSVLFEFEGDINAEKFNVEIVANDTTTADTAIYEFEYLLGDANMHIGLWPPRILGSDITYLSNYFKGYPTSIPCYLSGFWASADANGNCIVGMSDVTKLVNYFKGQPLIQCSVYVPAWNSTNDAPGSAPNGWPNCDQSKLLQNTTIIPIQSIK